MESTTKRPIDIPRLNDCRDRLGWSQEKLAAEAGVDLRTVQRVYASGCITRRSHGRILDAVARGLQSLAENRGIPVTIPSTLLLGLTESASLDSSTNVVEPDERKVSLKLGHRIIEVAVKGDMLDFSSEECLRVMRAIAEILGIDPPPSPQYFHSGSVWIAVLLTPEQIAALTAKLNSPTLQQVGIINVREPAPPDELADLTWPLDSHYIESLAPDGWPSTPKVAQQPPFDLSTIKLDVDEETLKRWVDDNAANISACTEHSPNSSLQEDIRKGIRRVLEEVKEESLKRQESNDEGDPEQPLGALEESFIKRLESEDVTDRREAMFFLDFCGFSSQKVIAAVRRTAESDSDPDVRTLAQAFLNDLNDVE